MAVELHSRVPSGPRAQEWHARRDAPKVVGSTKKGEYRIRVVDSGLAGASATTSLADLDHLVTSLCFQDSPRRAEDAEAKRDDERFSNVAVWSYAGENERSILSKQPLVFEAVTPSTRSYK